MSTGLHANASGLDLHEDKRIKEPVRVASTANVTLATPGSTMDGVTLTSGDRILLKNQSTASQNGIYTWTGASTTLTRTTDADAAADFVYGFKVYVRQGTANGGTYCTYTQSGAVTLNTTSLTFTTDGVSLSMPAEFTVAGTNAAPTVSKASQNANTVWAGPASGSATTPTFRTLVAADIPSTPYVNVQDQKTSGTASGGLTSGAWRTRTLNTTVTDTASIASLATNQITLPIGTYRCAIRVPGYFVRFHQARLQNTTASTTLLTGTSEFNDAAGSGITTNSFISGVFQLSVSSVLEVQHQVSLTNGTNGGGAAASFGTEVYTVAEFWKIA